MYFDSSIINNKGQHQMKKAKGANTNSPLNWSANAGLEPHDNL